MSIGPIARALPTAHAHAQLQHHAEFASHARRMRKANAQSRVPFWDPHVFLGHRIGRRLMRLPGALNAPLQVQSGSDTPTLEINTIGLTRMAHQVQATEAERADGATCAARRAAEAWDDTAFDDELQVRKATTLLAWTERPVVITAPLKRLSAAWRDPWQAPAPVDVLRALGPAAYYLALGPGFEPQGVQDQRLDHWLEGVFVCLDEHLDGLSKRFDLNVVLLHYDLRDGPYDTTACIALDSAITLSAARQVRLAQAEAEARRTPALLTLSELTAMRVVSLVLDVMPEVNYQVTSRRLAWSVMPNQRAPISALTSMVA